MAKPSTVITKKDSKEGLIKSKGILRLDEMAEFTLILMTLV